MGREDSGRIQSRALVAVVVGLCCMLLFGVASPVRAEDPAVAVGADIPAVRVDGGRFVDASGRTVLLRGVNVNQLGDYFQADPGISATIPLEARDLERIAALGLNHVRLLVHWSRLEPEPGRHDAAYLAEIRQAVEWARDAGLWVVLDMHQDAWGKHVNTSPDDRCLPPLLEPAIGWDGAPEWATFTDGASRCALLGWRELSPAVLTAWSAFWSNRGDIQDHLVETWAYLAAAFRDDPTIIGYDLLNEPGFGWKLWGHLQDKARFHARALDAIRAAEAGGAPKIVFFEPFGVFSGIPLEQVIRWTSDPQVAYAPHTYAESIAAFLPITLDFAFQEMSREAGEYGTPLWVGEWGWFAGPSDWELRFAALEDRYRASSANWQWKQACGDPHSIGWPGLETLDELRLVVVLGCNDPDEPGGVDLGLDPMTATVLSRPYPRAFPGDVRFESDPVGRRLVLDGSDGSGGTLEIWVPGEAVPVVATTGADVSGKTRVEGGWIVDVMPTAGTYEVEATGS